MRHLWCPGPRPSSGSSPAVLHARRSVAGVCISTCIRYDSRGHTDLVDLFILVHRPDNLVNTMLSEVIPTPTRCAEQEEGLDVCQSKYRVRFAGLRRWQELQGCWKLLLILAVLQLMTIITAISMSAYLEIEFFGAG